MIFENNSPYTLIQACAPIRILRIGYPFLKDFFWPLVSGRFWQHWAFNFFFTVYQLLLRLYHTCILQSSMGRKHKANEDMDGGTVGAVVAKKSKPSAKRKKRHSESDDSDVDIPKGV